MAGNQGKQSGLSSKSLASQNLGWGRKKESHQQAKGQKVSYIIASVKDVGVFVVGGGGGGGRGVKERAKEDNCMVSSFGCLFWKILGVPFLVWSKPYSHSIWGPNPYVDKPSRFQDTRGISFNSLSNHLRAQHLTFDSNNMDISQLASNL